MFEPSPMEVGGTSEAHGVSNVASVVPPVPPQPPSWTLSVSGALDANASLNASTLVNPLSDRPFVDGAQVSAPSSAQSGAAQVPLLVPSLKGKMTQEGSWIICRGMWAMSDAQHANPDLTSEFEFKINAASPAVVSALQAGTIPRSYPLDGLYQGWFKLRKQPPLKGTDKIDEKGLLIMFRQDEDESADSAQEEGDSEDEGEGAVAKSTYRVEGQGSNKFGNFTLKGSFDASTGDIVMYREYVARPFKPLVSQVARVKRERPASTDASASSLIRDGVSRIRKQSSFVTDFDNVAGQGGERRVSRPEITPAQRLALQMQRCKTIHTEISKLPQAVYFLEPVDPIKLNIPDYPLIVTQPMDLGTIGARLSAEGYPSPAEFADDVRLVFKNALTYNVLKENPVHIAAKECSVKFEDKFRSQVQSLNAGQSRSSSSASAAKKAASKKFPGQNKGASSNAPSAGGGGASRSKTGGFDYSAIPDASMAAMLEMQKQMLEMQNELNRLRSAVGHDALAGDLGKPLTLQEKKDLIHNISGLHTSHMERVVQIVQQGAPERAAHAETDDVEIPLDELDTYTLRRLQSYVNDVRRKDRGSSAGLGSPAHKRSRTNNGGVGTYSSAGGGAADEIEYADRNTSSLFPETF